MRIFTSNCTITEELCFSGIDILLKNSKYHVLVPSSNSHQYSEGFLEATLQLVWCGIRFSVQCVI